MWYKYRNLPSLIGIPISHSLCSKSTLQCSNTKGVMAWVDHVLPNTCSLSGCSCLSEGELWCGDNVLSSRCKTTHPQLLHCSAAVLHEEGLMLSAVEMFGSNSFCCTKFLLKYICEGYLVLKFFILSRQLNFVFHPVILLAEKQKMWKDHLNSCTFVFVLSFKPCFI